MTEARDTRTARDSKAWWGEFSTWNEERAGEEDDKTCDEKCKGGFSSMSDCFDDCSSSSVSFSPCKVIIRSRHASTPWERLVRAVVGDPVHLDVVLAKEGSAGARFCFSSYMNQKFEMVMMDQSLVNDDNVTNMMLEISEDEHDRCTRFLMSLEGKASYDYLDAMLLMPMAPKGTSPSARKSFSSSMFNALVEDADAYRPEQIKKVFCSQSVVLMLRQALDPGGKHSGLLQTLNALNSRLVSPKQVHCILQDYGAQPISNQMLGLLPSSK